MLVGRLLPGPARRAQARAHLSGWLAATGSPPVPEPLHTLLAHTHTFVKDSQTICPVICKAHIPLFHLLRRPEATDGVTSPRQHNRCRRRRLMKAVILTQRHTTHSGAGGSRGVRELITLLWVCGREKNVFMWWCRRAGNVLITCAITHKTAGTTAFELERWDLFTERDLSKQQFSVCSL